MAVFGDQLLIPESGWQRYRVNSLVDSYITYSGGSWLRSTFNLYDNGANLANAIGDYCRFNFTGDRIRIIGYFDTDSTHYQKITVDGIGYEFGTLKTDHPLNTYKYQAVIFTLEGLSEGVHEFKYEKLAGDPHYICIDSIDLSITGSLTNEEPLVNKYLIKDTSNNNIYNIVANSLNLIGNNIITEQLFLDNGLNNLDELDQILLNTMSGGNINIYQYTQDISIVNRDITFDYIPNPQLILPTGDIDISSIVNIDSFNLTATATNNSDLKIALSIDSGTTWKAWNGSSWVYVDMGFEGHFKTNGMTITTINGLTSEQIMSFIGESNTIRFAYYMELDNINDTLNTDSIAMTVDMNGSWKKAKYGTDYIYGYPNNITFKVQLLANGDYKINY
jgi:hypothetical protein